MTSTHRTAHGTSTPAGPELPIPALAAAGLAALTAVAAATLAFTATAVWRSLRTRQHSEAGDAASANRD
ncbi:hypothetical protein ACWEHA_07285 [Amycolatopsis nivea]